MRIARSRALITLAPLHGLRIISLLIGETRQRRHHLLLFRNRLAAALDQKCVVARGHREVAGGNGCRAAHLRNEIALVLRLARHGLCLRHARQRILVTLRLVQRTRSLQWLGDLRPERLGRKRRLADEHSTHPDR